MSIETHVKGILFLSFFMANCCLSAAIPIQTEDLGIHSFSTYNNTSRSIVKYEKTKVERLLQYNKDSACLYIENLLRRASFLYDTVLLTEAFYLKGIAFYMDASFDTAAVFSQSPPSWLHAKDVLINAQPFIVKPQKICF